MTLLISLLTGLAAGVATAALFEWRCGRSAWRPAMQAELDRMRVTTPAASRADRLRRFLAPPAISRLRAFWLRWAAAVAGALIAGRLLTGSWLWAVAMAIVAFVVFRQAGIRQAKTRRRQLLSDQFKDALSSISASIRAGNSLITAFERVVPDLERILRGQAETPVIEEMSCIIREIRLGSSLEEALVRFRDRAGLEDVSDFVNATLLCRVRGGNLTEVIGTTAQIIADKIAVRHQMKVLTSGKRMEFWLLTLAPPGMVGFLAVSSPDYLKPLVDTFFGQALVALAILLLAGAYLIGRRIVDLEV